VHYHHWEALACYGMRRGRDTRQILKTACAEDPWCAALCRRLGKRNLLRHYASGVRIFATSCLRGYSRGPTVTGKDGGLGTVTAAELGQDVTHMGVDGALGDEEPLGDLLVRQAPRD